MKHTVRNEIKGSTQTDTGNRMNSAMAFSTSEMNLWVLLVLGVVANCCCQNNGALSCPALCSCFIVEMGVEVVCSQDSLTHFPIDGLSNSTTSLSIQSTNLTFVTTSHLSVVPILKNLQLYHNTLRSLPADLLRGVPYLNTLDLTGNNLSHLPPNVFSHAPLHSLVLKNNMIEKADAEWFSGNSNLTWLDLSGNRLTAIPSALLQKLPHLENLDFGGNNILEVPPNALTHLPSLEKLNLAGNKLSTLDPSTFINTHKLTHLFLQENQLQDLPPTLLQSLQHLELLLLNQNQLQHLPFGLLGQLSHQGERSSPLRAILSQNPWVCDVKMEYLWRWLTAHPENVFFLEEVTCSSPEALKDRQVVSLTENELGLIK